MTLYTQRNALLPDKFVYDFSQRARSRLFALLEGAARDYSRMEGHFQIFQGLDGVFRTADRFLRQETGELATGSLFGGTSPPDGRLRHNPVARHFFNCESEQVLDVVELSLMILRKQVGNDNIDSINKLLRGEGIGFEFTQIIYAEETKIEEGKSYHPVLKPSMALKKTNELAHQEIIRPALQLLTDPRFATANQEMLLAHEHFRHGRLADTLTLAGAAFESVMKTICVIKPYPGSNPDKDTNAKLAEHLYKNGLITLVVKDMLIYTGRVRNEMSTAHGRAQSSAKPADLADAGYMLNVTSSQIIYLFDLMKA